MPPPPPPPIANRRKPVGPDPEKTRDRARGALLGLAVGDALGTTLEFKALPAPQFPELCTGPHTDITGGGPFKVKPGQVTDDTQMAAALAMSLRVVKRFSADDVLSRYRAWLPHAFDVGNQTRTALSDYNAALGPFHAAKMYWLHNGKKPAGNGSLMRAAPVGVYFAGDREARVSASIEDSALTHYDPRCALACAAFNAAIAAAINSPGDPDRKKLLGVVQSELSIAAAQLGRFAHEHVREVQDATAAVKQDLELAQQDDPQLYGPEIHMHHHQGFVRVAFRLAFWELFHAPSFEAALIDVVNRGGDADTNGAITGALLGAFYGETEIPKRWRTPVLEVAPAQAAFRDTYHPTQLLPLVD